MTRQLAGRLKATITEHRIVLLAAAIFLVGQWPLLSLWWAKYWSDMNGYYSHGVLVPFMCGAMVWANRGRLYDTQSRGSWIGPVLLLASLPLYVVGLLVEVQLLNGLAFMLSVFGLVLSFFGVRITRALLLPLAFLVAMIPLANYLLDTVTLRFQLTSTTLAARTLGLLGYSVQQVGNTITSIDLPKPLQVGIPCSGLKLLVTLLTCLSFVAYMVEAPWWKKAALVALSLPLSIACNTLRVVLIGLVGFRTGSASSLEAFHDPSGAISLAICVAIVYAVMYLAGLRTLREFPVGAALSTLGGNLRTYPGSAPITAIALTCLSASTLFAWAAAPASQPPRGHLPRQNIPYRFGRWVGTDLDIDSKTKAFMGDCDLLSRVYGDTSCKAQPVYVFMAAGVSAKEFHDPRMCLSVDDQVVEDEGTVTLHLQHGNPTTLNARLLRATGGEGSSLVIYWYMQGLRSWADTAALTLGLKREALMEGLRAMSNPLELHKRAWETSRGQIVWYRFSSCPTDGPVDQRQLRAFIQDFLGTMRGQFT